jgi:hypothetical protein
MEETLEESINLPRITESLKRVARTIWPRTRTTSAAHPSKNAKTALTPRDKSPETSANAGLLLVIPSGKLLSMALSQELTT